MRVLWGDFVTGRAAAGLLLFRLVTGVALMIHGWPKAQHPFDWMDKMPGAHPPALLQGLAALGEFGGGMGLLFGCLTPIAAFGVMCVMGYAILKVHGAQVWIAPGNPKAFESAASYFISALMLAITGPGVYSLDAQLFGAKRRENVEKTGAGPGVFTPRAA